MSQFQIQLTLIVNIEIVYKIVYTKHKRFAIK